MFSLFQEICAEPRLFADSPQEGQVKQGLLGDCWFLCACAALQKSRRLLDQVSAPARAPLLPASCLHAQEGRAGSRPPARWGS